MTKRLEKLSEEQAALIPAVTDEWVKFCLGGDSTINRQAAAESLRWMYGKAKLQSPFVIFVDGPLACQYAAWFVNALVRDKKSSAQVSAQVRDQVLAQVSAQVRDQVRDQVKSNYVEYGWCDLAGDAGWVSFYDFFTRLGIEFSTDFKKYSDYVKSGPFMTILLNGFAIVCPRPSKITKDERKRLHGETSAAAEWSNGEKYYFWHGSRVTEKIITRPTEITRDDIVNEKNSEVSRVMAERLGWDEFMKRADTFLVDKWFDPAQKLHYELYDFKHRFELMPKLLKMESPELHDGTRPHYVEPVHPALKTCQAARRWQFQNMDGSWPEPEECNANQELVFEEEA